VLAFRKQERISPDRLRRIIVNSKPTSILKDHLNKIPLSSHDSNFSLHDSPDTESSDVE